MIDRRSRSNSLCPSVCQGKCDSLESDIYSTTGERVRKTPNVTQAEKLTVEDLCSAETVIIKAVQTQRFAKQIERLKTSKNQNNRIRQLRKNDPLYKLDPFIDGSGLLRVCGRLDRSSLEDKEKHPIILPKQGQVTQLIVRSCHEDVQHQGRGLTVF